MKIKIQFKDPDGVSNAIIDAAAGQIAAMDELDDDERESAEEMRRDKIAEALKPWVRYGEYLEVEFDTDARTAKVLPAKS